MADILQQIPNLQSSLVSPWLLVIGLLVLVLVARGLREKRRRKANMITEHIEETLAHPVWEGAPNRAHAPATPATQAAQATNSDHAANSANSDHRAYRDSAKSDNSAAYDGILYLDHARHLHPPMANTYTIPPEHYQYLFRVGAGKLLLENQDTLEIHTQTARFQYKVSELGKLYFHHNALVMIPIFDNRQTLMFLSRYAEVLRESLASGHSLG